MHHVLPKNTPMTGVRQPRAILFLCVANSARSQMAEGIARALAPAVVRVFSAGSQPSAVHPLAVRALEEIGIDVSSQFSKGLDAVPVDEIDTVVTLCAEEVCPVLLRQVSRFHWPQGPAAAGEGDDEQHLVAFRRVRDELRARIPALFLS